MKLNNKRIIITGGTSGIGLELVRQLCRDNEVIVISRSAALSGDTPEAETPVTVFQADLGSRVELEAVVNQIIRSYHSLDMLINNAAIQNTPEFLSDEFDYDGIQREIDINFTSICQLTYLMLPLLQKNDASVLLNINSGLGLSPKRASAIYCATKGALNIFTQSLRYQLADTSISVQQVFLPIVETAMTAGRGSGKLRANDVAKTIIDGIERDKLDHDIGKAKALRLLLRFAPFVARAILKNS